MFGCAPFLRPGLQSPLGDGSFSVKPGQRPPRLRRAAGFTEKLPAPRSTGSDGKAPLTSECGLPEINLSLRDCPYRKVQDGPPTCNQPAAAYSPASQPSSPTTATGPVAHASETSPDWGSVELLDAEDRTIRVDQSAQPLTLLVLWANWCSVCLRELDATQSIRPAIGADNIRVILVSHPKDWARNQDVARSRGLTLPCARLSPNTRPSFIRRALLSDDGTFYVPHTILFSRPRNEVVLDHVGSLDWRSPEVLTRIRG